MKQKKTQPEVQAGHKIPFWNFQKKLLILFIVLTVLIPIGFVEYSNSKYIQDKKIYIQEECLRKSEVLANELSQIFEKSVSLANLIIKANILSGDFKEGVWSQGENLWSVGYRSFEKSWSHLKHPSRKDNNKNSKIFQEIFEFVSSSKLIGEHNIQFFKVDEFDFLFFLFRSGKRHFYFVLDISEYNRKLVEDNIYTFSLVNNKKAIQLGDKASTLVNSIDLSKKTKRGKGNYLIEHNGDSHLVSLIKINDLKHTLVGHIPLNKAMAFVYETRSKLYSILMMVLGIGLIITIFLTKRMLSPINSLIQMADEFSKENFGKRAVIRSKDEFEVLGNAFNLAGDKIKELIDNNVITLKDLESAKEKIEDYSRNLEGKVNAQTRLLREVNEFTKAVFNSINQGLIVLNIEGKCTELYSAMAERLFPNIKEGLSLEEIMELSEKDSQHFQSWLGIVKGGKLDWESTKGLGLKKLQRGNNFDDERFRYLEFDYFQVLDDEEKLKNLVLIASDKTEVIVANAKAQEQQKLAQMVLKISANTNAFLRFVSEVDDYLNRLTELANSGWDQKEAKLIAHTLFGSFGLYSWHEMATASRTLEEIIIDLPEDVNDFNFALEFHEKYKKSKENLFNLMGLSEDNLTFSKTSLLEVANKLNNEGHARAYEIILSLINSETVEQLFTSYSNLMGDLANSLGKKVMPIEFIKGDILLDKRNFLPFINVLVHLFRNIVDHGIEEPSIRSENNKKEAGLVKITSSQSDQRIQIEIKDDGAGIDPSRIREKLIELGKESDSQKSDEDIIYHIFDEDFSTALELTELSGRGVGMSAIAKTVKEMGGEYKLSSKHGEGTIFSFDLPLGSANASPLTPN